MPDPDGEALSRQLLMQSEACGRLGSPLYASLLASAAADALGGGAVRTVLAGHEHDPPDHALALRLLGAVHDLVLAGRAPALARWYPSVGGGGRPQEAWPAFLAVLQAHGDAVRAGLASPPQTNEVGRAAALLGGLLHLAADRGAAPLRVRLVEIGASAGLNLRADAFAVELPGGRRWGLAGTPVVLPRAWEGVLPPTGARFTVVERVGSDVAPLEVASDEGRRRLLAYVWPDQIERLARTRAALDIAARMPVTVTMASAGDAVARLRLGNGTTTVLWHSVMWQYLPGGERRVVQAMLGALGEQASDEARLAHLFLEPPATAPWHDEPRPGGPVVRRLDPGDAGFRVALRTWPGGLLRELGTAAPRGLPVRWDGAGG